MQKLQKTNKKTQKLMPGLNPHLSVFVQFTLSFCWWSKLFLKFFIHIFKIKIFCFGVLKIPLLSKDGVKNGKINTDSLERLTSRLLLLVIWSHCVFKFLYYETNKLPDLIFLSYISVINHTELCCLIIYIDIYCFFKSH